VDISEAQLASAIIAEERKRLGIDTKPEEQPPTITT